ncbi:MAG: hypothetical protein II655_12910 [Thermoguttaceae bacterium]|nr:hypothetical protein [Thermoguttaceae bacterium]
MKTWSFLAAIAVAFSLVCFTGCKKDDGLCDVEGTVTLDGQPLASGTINMGPMAGQSGRGVGGKIENGMYKLRASEGEMVVTIRSQQKQKIENPTEDEQAHGVTERQVELIPDKYNQRSELRATI